MVALEGHAACQRPYVLLLVLVFPPPSAPLVFLAALLILTALPWLAPLLAWPLFLALALVHLVWVPLLWLALFSAMVLSPFAVIIVLPPLLLRRPYLLLLVPLVLLRMPAFVVRLSPARTAGGPRPITRLRGEVSLHL